MLSRSSHLLYHILNLSPNIHARNGYDFQSKSESTSFWRAHFQSKSEYHTFCRCIFNLSPNMCVFGGHIFNLSPNMCLVFGFVYFRVAIVVFCLDTSDNSAVQKHNNNDTNSFKYVLFGHFQSESEYSC